MPYVSYQDWWNQRNKPNQYGVTAPPVGAPSESSVYSDPYKGGLSSAVKPQMGAAINMGMGAAGGAVSGNPVAIATGAALGGLQSAPAQAAAVNNAMEHGDHVGAQANIPLWVQSNPFLAGPARVAVALGTMLKRQPQTQVEEKRWGKLRDAGFEIPAWVKDGTDIKDPHAGYNDKLAADHIGITDQGWNNNKFAQSRDVADLRPEDLLGYAAPVEAFGTSWTKADEGTRKSILQQALDAGAVDEHHGTVDINWSDELKQQALDLLGKASAARPENAGRKVWVPPTNGWKPPGQ